MQLRNNYDKDVFNGDLGYIREVDTEERTLTVDFDGQMGRVRCNGARRADAGLRHDDPQGAGIGVSDRGHAGADDPFRDAPAQPDLYGYHAGQEDLRADRCDEALAYAVRNLSVLKRNTSLRERLNPSLTTDGKLRG